MSIPRQITFAPIPPLARRFDRYDSAPRPFSSVKGCAYPEVRMVDGQGIIDLKDHLI